MAAMSILSVVSGLSGFVLALRAFLYAGCESSGCASACVSTGWLFSSVPEFCVCNAGVLELLRCGVI